MLRRDLLRTLTATPLAGWLRSWAAQAFGGAATGERDAAAMYRKAFGWVKGLRPEDSGYLRESATRAIDDRRVDALLRQAGTALEAIRKAATIEQCDWGIEIATDRDLGRGHLDAINVHVVRVACLSGRRLAGSGRYREALDDVFAGLTLAHRVGTGGVLIARLLECGGEVAAFQALSRIVPELDRAALDDLALRLAALPPPEPASAAIGPESRFLLGSLRAGLAATGPVIAGADWGRLGFDEVDAAMLRRLTGGHRDRVLAHLDATGPAFAELARRLDLPRPGCRAALEEFARVERAAHPLAAGLVEGAWGVRHMVDRMHALRAMLRAGLMLVRDGEPAFRAEADPFGRGAFGLERRGNGYRIRSALKDRGKPEVSLEIGEAVARN